MLRSKILTQLKDENSLNLNHKVDGQRIRQAGRLYFSSSLKSKNMLLKAERQLIVEYGKKMLDAGLTKGTDGNISIGSKYIK